MRRHHALLIIAAVWAASAVLSLPTLLFSTHVTFASATYTRSLCLLHWPDGPQGQSTWDYIYNILFSFLTYGVPMMTMAVTYTQMARVLWGGTPGASSHSHSSRKAGRRKSTGIQDGGPVTWDCETDPQREAHKAKQKVVRMLIAVVIIFALCWLPYHAYFLIVFHWPEVNKYTITQHLYLAAYWLAMSNSMYNPIIYCWMNARFRNYFARILCPIFCCKRVGRYRDPRDIRNRNQMHGNQRGAQQFETRGTRSGSRANVTSGGATTCFTSTMAINDLGRRISRTATTYYAPAGTTSGTERTVSRLDSGTTARTATGTGSGRSSSAGGIRGGNGDAGLVVEMIELESFIPPSEDGPRSEGDERVVDTETGLREKSDLTESLLSNNNHS